MKFLKYSSILACAFIINSCKNDLKLNAPYKEIPSVYAILNPNDSIQMIRINKVFLGEGDANQMAQIADSVNYPAGELTVTLERTNIYGLSDFASGNKKTITFTESIIETTSGAFNTSQRVYITTDKLFSNGVYHIKIKNNKTGNVFTAKSDAVDSIGPFLQPLDKLYYPLIPSAANKQFFVDYASGSNDGGSVRFIPTSSKVAPNKSVLFQMTMRFHFYDTLGNTQKTFHYVDYNFTTRNIKDIEVSGQSSFMKYSFKKADMFLAVGVGLSKMYLNDNIVGRKMYKLQFLIYSTTQDYIDYMQYVTPSLSIAQNKPLYSNFDNKAALGIFTCRSRFSCYKEMEREFISTFAYDGNTCKYQFLTSDGAKPGCSH